MADAIQYLVVGLLVAAAILYLGRRVVRQLSGRGNSRCGGCSSCSSTFVNLTPLESPRGSSSDAAHRTL
ncbi:MAG: FeoB-associated Cys-rich membrane protein [Pirellulaceae bacterium]